MRKNVLIMWLLVLPSLAAEPVKGPIFNQFGPVFSIKDPNPPLPANHQYRVVFDVANSREGLEKRNPYLESVARFINMHAANGVTLEQMSIAVVLHGSATDNALSHRAHQQRFGKDNPNLAMIFALHKAGVSFHLCGQSAGFRGVSPSELAEPIDVALSAMTALVLLQDQGYRLLP